MGEERSARKVRLAPVPLSLLFLLAASARVTQHRAPRGIRHQRDIDVAAISVDAEEVGARQGGGVDGDGLQHGALGRRPVLCVEP